MSNRHWGVSTRAQLPALPLPRIVTKNIRHIERHIATPRKLKGRPREPNFGVSRKKWLTRGEPQGDWGHALLTPSAPLRQRQLGRRLSGSHGRSCGSQYGSRPPPMAPTPGRPKPRASCGRFSKRLAKSSLCSMAPPPIRWPWPRCARRTKASSVIDGRISARTNAGRRDSLRTGRHWFQWTDRMENSFPKPSWPRCARITGCIVRNHAA